MIEPNHHPIHGELEYRSMRVEDIPEIHRIELESFPTPWSEGAFQNELVHNDFAHYIVMLLDDKIIGFGGMWLIMEEAHITNIAIRQEYRGKHLGNDLLAEMIRVAAFLGAVRMTLEVRTSNHIAQSLYEKFGFYAAGIRKRYYSDNHEDAIVMWADLKAGGFYA